MKNSSYKSIFKAIILMISLPKIMLGYIGPGTSLTAIGSLVACIVGIIVTVLGFLWYPIKRILNRGAEKADQMVADQVEDKSPQED